MSMFVISVRRSHADGGAILAEAHVVWYAQGQRVESQLVRLVLDKPQGPSRVILAEALEAMAAQLRPPAD